MLLQFLPYPYETQKYLRPIQPKKLFQQKDYSVKVSYISCLTKFLQQRNIVLVF